MPGVLITGARGFVGRNVVAVLRERPGCAEEIHCVSRAARRESSLNWHQVDLLDSKAVSALLRQVRPTRLLHAAWCSAHTEYWDSAKNLSWVAATLHLFSEFAALGGRRSLGVGSCAEYQPGPEPVSELEALRPAGLYGAAKAATSMCLEAAAPTLDLSHAWARLFFPYGPGDQPTRLVPSVIKALLSGSSIDVTSGLQLRDPLYVTDVAAALVAVLDSDLRGPVNVASGDGVSIREIVQQLGEISGRSHLMRVGARPCSPRDEASWVADVTKLREETSWKPRVSLDEGLHRTLLAYQSEGVDAASKRRTP